MRRVAIFLAGLMVCSSVAASAGGSSRPLVVDDFARVQTVFEPQLSPDGSTVAYLVRSLDLAADESRIQLWQASVDGRERLQLTHERKVVSSPRWSPDRRYLSFLAARKKGEVDSTQLWVFDRRGGEAQPLTDVAGELFEYAWSPDGKRLALVIRETDRSDTADESTQRPQPYVIDRYQFKDDSDGYLHQQLRPARIYLYEIATKSLAALTIDARFAESTPVWSPDGARLAFVSNRDEQADRTINDDIWVADARPGATPRRLTTFPGKDVSPEWSPDGSKIVYLQGREPRYAYYGPYTLAVVSVKDGAVHYPASGLDRDVGGPRFSADGRLIRFVVDDNRESYLAQVPAAGGPVQRLTTGDLTISDYAVSAGRTVVVSSRSAQPSELYALERGAPRQLTRYNEGWLKDVAFANTEDFQFTARDGTTIYGVLTRPAAAANEKSSALPLVLWIHGGPYGQDSQGFHFQRQLFAAQGYAVLQINYRGSSGRGAAFGHGSFADWGNKDLTDLLDGVNQAIERGIADPERLMVGGWSNGGIMTNYVIARDARFKAAIAGAGYGNLISFYGSDMYSFVYDNELGPPWADRERWLRLSYPLFEADKIRTPTLFVGGQQDFNVPIVGGEQMYQALKSLNVPTQLVIYPGEHHGIGRPSFQRDLLGRYVSWFAKHVPAKPIAQRDYVWLTAGEPTGRQVVKVYPQGRVSVDFTFNDRGRGPETTTEMTLGADGQLVALTVTGVNYAKGAVDERFKIDGDRASWRSSLERGEAPVQANHLYFPVEQPPEYLAVLARAALARKGQPLDLWPGGSVQIEAVQTLMLSIDGQNRRATLYALTGLGLNPSYVWLDENRDLIGYDAGWFAILRKEWSAYLQAIKAAQEAALARHIQAQVERFRTQIDRPVAIVNTRVLDVAAGRLQPPGTVLMRDGRIVEIGASVVVPNDAHVVDAGGKTLMPALWDMHGHIGPDDYLNYIASGVLNVRDMGNDPNYLAQLRANLAAGTLAAPDVYPMGFIDKQGALAAPTGRLAATLEDARRFVQSYADERYVGIKLYSSIEPAWVPALTREAQSRGLRVAGHIPAFMSPAQAIRDGYTEVTHINMILLQLIGDASIDTRTPQRFIVPGERGGLIDLESKQTTEFFDLLAQRQIAHDPTLAVFMDQYDALPGATTPSAAGFADHLPPSLRRDQIADVGFNHGKEEAFRHTGDMALKLIKRLHERGVRILPGTDASLPGFVLISELEYYARAGIANDAVLRLATSSPAEYLGQERELGSVEVGKRAYVMLIDGDPTQDLAMLRKVELVVKGTALFRPREILQAQGIKPF